MTDARRHLEGPRAVARVEESEGGRGPCSDEGLPAQSEVVVNDGDRIPLGGELAGTEQDCPVAEVCDGFHVVADEQDGAAPFAQLPEAPEAALLEEHVADRQGLVHDVHVRVEVREEREGEPHEHSRRVLADRLVDELADLGEVEDGLQPITHVSIGEAEELRALEHVLPAGEVGLEARAELQQGHHAPPDLERPRRGIEGPGEDLQQRALPGAVQADDAEALSGAHLKAHVA
jgi:hypothetical protein